MDVHDLAYIVFFGTEKQRPAMSLNVFQRMASTVFVGKDKIQRPVNWSVLACHCKFVADMLELANYEPPKYLLECFSVCEDDVFFEHVWRVINGVAEATAENLPADHDSLVTSWNILDYLRLNPDKKVYRSLAKITAETMVEACSFPDDPRYNLLRNILPDLVWKFFDSKQNAKAQITVICPANHNIIRISDGVSGHWLWS